MLRTVQLACRSRKFGSHAFSPPDETFLTILDRRYPKDLLTNITSSILSKVPLRLHSQPSHPLNTLRQIIESHYPDYAHLSSLSPVVTPYQNFDQLSFPQDHPGRSVTDSYYVNRDWMLRTHTSAHEVEVFAQGHSKWLLTADVYRRDEIDGSHYPVFHQMEGARLFAANPSGMADVKADNERLAQHLRQFNIQIEDVPHITPSNPAQPVHDPTFSELIAQNLKLSLNSLIFRLFGAREIRHHEDPLRIRWIEAFFPFTAPSYEVEVFFRGQWLEILGCGVVKQATLDCASA
jgi:phenylalanyl-tRNA synthetase alpha chain